MPTVTRDGIRLHYSQAGSGPPVFFHTGGGGDGTMWQTAGYLDALPGRRHVVFDHRGHGRSDHPKDLESHRIAEYTRTVLIASRKRVERLLEDARATLIRWD